MKFQKEKLKNIEKIVTTASNYLKTSIKKGVVTKNDAAIQEHAKQWMASLLFTASTDYYKSDGDLIEVDNDIINDWSHQTARFILFMYSVDRDRPKEFSGTWRETIGVYAYNVYDEIMSFLMLSGNEDKETERLRREINKQEDEAYEGRD